MGYVKSVQSSKSHLPSKNTFSNCPTTAQDTCRIHHSEMAVLNVALKNDILWLWSSLSWAFWLCVRRDLDHFYLLETHHFRFHSSQESQPFVISTLALRIQFESGLQLRGTIWARHSGVRSCALRFDTRSPPPYFRLPSTTVLEEC